MKEYRATITVNVFIPAKSQEEAEELFGDMEIEFTHPDNDEELLMSDLIDMDIVEVGELDEDDLSDFED